MGQPDGIQECKIIISVGNGAWVIAIPSVFS